MPVDLVHIHHEGSLANGGAPSDDVGRFSEGGYCYGIGATLWQRFRSPADNWATLNYNGEDLTLCYSGDHHTGTALRDVDLELLHAAFMDSYERGEVTATPAVVAHRNAGRGNATACPGDFTMARWADVEAACRAGAPAPKPEPGGEDVPKEKDYVAAFASEDGAWLLQYDGGVSTKRGRFYGSYFSLPPTARNDPARRFLTISAPLDDSKHGYSLVSLNGEVYTFPTPVG